MQGKGRTDVNMESCRARQERSMHGITQAVCEDLGLSHVKGGLERMHGRGQGV